MKSRYQLKPPAPDTSVLSEVHRDDGYGLWSGDETKVRQGQARSDQPRPV